MDLKPIFLEPAIKTTPRAIRPQDQREFDECGHCADCINMLELGLVEALDSMVIPQAAS